MLLANDRDRSLKVTTCMAENMDSFCRQVTEYIGKRLNITAEFINDLPWQERERLVDAGRIQVCWICGLPYVWKSVEPAGVELLAAPVMSAKRYNNRPIYFSDVVVHRESGFRTFADLRGATWVYNEPRSHSGFNIVRYHLATLGEGRSYFGRTVESGAHQASLRMILNREADFSAIDSTVLELEYRRSPELLSNIRLIEILGPSPMPPWVVLKNLSQDLKENLRTLLLQMHTDSEGFKILSAAAMMRFASVEESDYSVIQSMAERADVLFGSDQ